MKINLKNLWMAALLALSAALLVSVLVLGAPNNYAVPWWTVDGGGSSSQSAGGQYTIQGTIGQPDPGSSQGGEYSLEGGFWARIQAWFRQFFIHLPVVMR